MVLSFLGVAVTPGFAYYDEYKQNIKDGIEGFVKSPKPLVEAVKEEYKESEFKPFGVFGGVVKGGFYSLKEMGWSLIRIVTFNVGVD